MSDADTNSDDGKAPPKGYFSLASIGTIAATISLVLLLLGYGVSLAVETKFGIPHATLYDSPSDLIDLAGVVLMVLITRGSEVVVDPSFYAKAYSESWIALLAASMLVVVAIGLGMLWLSKQAKLSPVERKKRARRWKRFGPPAAIIVSLVTMPVLAGLLALTLIAAGIVICILPTFGMQAAKAHFQQWVIDPKECHPMIEELEGRKESFADCVVVKKPGDDPEKADVVLGEGRVVLATTKHIVLWVPHEHARRVPISETIIEPVSSIRAAKVQGKEKSAAESTVVAPAQSPGAMGAPAASQPSK